MTAAPKKEWRNWFGLRCWTLRCPCAPADGGWRCVTCGKREFWTEEMRKHYEGRDE
jgi:hypothetical protein